MDARTANSPVISQQHSWLSGSGPAADSHYRISALVGLFLIAMIALSLWVLRRGAEPGAFCRRR